VAWYGAAMAVSSSMLPLGTPLPRFALLDVTSGRTVDASELEGRIAVVAFLCNHCPYVKHIRSGLVALGARAEAVGARMVGICSNDPTTHPEDGPEAMAEEARRVGYPFPYLHDATQAVARAFDAACTPEVYVFDRSGRLSYRGRLDDSTPKNDRPVTAADVLAALDALSRGETPSPDQHPSIGCSIKWRQG